MITRWWLTYSSSGDLSPSFEASPISPMGGWKFRLLCPISVDEIHLKPHVGNHLNTYIYDNTILNHHWKMPTTILYGFYPICGFPKIGIPGKIIHFFIGFSITDQPAIGVPPWKPPYLPVGQPFLHRHRPATKGSASASVESWTMCRVSCASSWGKTLAMWMGNDG